MQKIGRYHIESELGKGAMGVVYKATDPNIGRLVALKTLRLDVHGIEAEEMRRRFQNEARAAGVLNHPNIITIYDAGEEQGLFYIAMEFIPGETLAELLQKQRVLPVDQIIGITRGVCTGLDFAHSKGIIHRDIKPANIMIAPDGTAKVMDFGIAKAAGNLTNTGQVLGTPNYMSPEQVKGRILDGRTDLFSLGVVLYEMLTGEKPFAGQNVTTIIYKIVNENPIPPRELDVSVHPGLSAVVTRALSKDPLERYQSGAKLACDLANYKAFGSDANATMTGMTTMAGYMGGDQTLVGAAPAPAVVPTPVASSTPPAVAQNAVTSSMAAAASVPAPATVAAANAPEPPPTATSSPKKSTAKIVFGTIAAVLAVFALLIGVAIAKRIFRPHDTAEDRQRIQEAMQLAQQAAKLNPQSPPANGTTVPAVPNPDKPSAEVPPVPAVQQGEVNFNSTPAGARVDIDGTTQDGWVTPLRGQKLDLGKHMITFTLDNFTPEKKTIEVVAGKKSNVDVKFASSTLGTVHISSEPDQADILLNGQATGKKTPADFTLPPGNQSFTLRKQGFEDSGDSITVEAGQTINITPKLTQLTGPNSNPFGRIGKFFRGQQGEDRGLLVVRTKPRGARVAINNVVLPGATPLRIPIKSGKYVLSIAMDGFQPVKRDVLVERGKQTGLDEELVRK